MKKVVRRLAWLLGAIAAIVLVLVVYLALPFSQTVTAFKRTASNLISSASGEAAIFTEEDIRDLPEPIQKYFASWTAICGDYVETNGILWPNTMQAVWHFEDGDLIYFDAKNAKVVFGY